MAIQDLFASMSQWINELLNLTPKDQNYTYYVQNDPGQVIYGELIWSAAILIAFLILGYVVQHIFEHYFQKLAKKTKTKLDDEILKNVKKPIYILVLFFGINFFILNLSILNQYEGTISILLLLIQVLLIAYIFTRVTNVIFAWYAEKQESAKKGSQHILFVFRGIFNGMIYLIALFVFMGMAGIDLTGLAIGGAAGAIVIGFALQSVLSDFFSAFSIYFDRPFEIGDYIIVGSYSGTVTKIGMKSTRVQLLQGEELVLPNSELTKASVRNFKNRKIIDPAKLENVHKIDRVHFTEFGDFSLNFDIVYYMKSQEYVKYRETQQAINFAIKEAFEKEGIEMAFPTQTIQLNK